MLLFGLTPPRQEAGADRAAEVAAATLARLAPLDVDGLVLYDLDDEADRNPDERPFPYAPTMDPARFASEHLGAWDKPLVVYRCVGKYDADDLGGWLGTTDPARTAGVFVGPSSGDKAVRTTLREAYALRRDVAPALPLGAVTIPERHRDSRTEHERMLRKQERGVGFFVSQVVYDADGSKSLVSDYVVACEERGLAPRPLVFTLSLCGSLRTLSFLQWLGVRVPPWVENALSRSDDPLAESFDHCLETAQALATYCARVGQPVGFNVESVSVRRTEIEATVELARQVRRLVT